MSDSAEAAKTIFINDEGELRCGWRILIFLVAFLIFSSMLAVVVAVLGMMFPAVRDLTSVPELGAPGSRLLAGSFLNTIILLTGALAASFVSARLQERRSLSSVGYKLHPDWSRDLALGLILGTVTLAISVGIMAAAGAVSFEVQVGDSRLALNLAALLLFFLFAAAFEELLVRGFAFQAIAHNIGPIAAIAITSVAFSLLHIRNPNMTFFSLFNTLLAGIWLGTAYWKTRSLWLATAVHASWNFAMVFIFGLPVSGLTTLTDLAWLRGRPGAPVWLSGGDYGPEGGVAATVSIVLSALLLWKIRMLRATPEMVAALRHGSRVTEAPADSNDRRYG